MGERIYKHQCKRCDTKFYIEDLKFVSIASCPKCNGNSIYVDEHRVNKQSKERSLLVIELQDETSVPKVFYEGKEIRGGKARVLFDWETEKAMPNSGGTKFNVEYADIVDGKPIQKGVGLAKGMYIEEEKVAISFKDLTEAERMRLSEKLRAWFD